MKAKLVKENNIYALFVDNKIFASTDAHPLKSITNKLSLKNCQAIERGYDLDELVEKSKHYTDDMTNIEECFVGHHRDGFRKGFQKALEILSDKKFTEEDMKRSISDAWIERGLLTQSEAFLGDYLKEYAKYLQQNEWEVEIEMNKPLAGNIPNEFHYFFGQPVPKLDADGCLILKRI